MPDNAVVLKTLVGKGYKVKIKKFYSPYLKAKIDEYNSRKVQKPTQESLKDEEPVEKETKKKKVTISDTGLELIEAVQFDTTLRKNVWTSNVEFEDKAGVKDKIKAEYDIPAKHFKMKIRNIAGDEIIIDSEKINQDP